MVSVPVRADSRGFVVFPFQELGIDPARVLGFHLAFSEGGAVRGNHRHPHNAEYLLLLSGDWTLSFKDPGSDSVQSLEFKTGGESVSQDGANRPLIVIPKDIPHTIQNSGTEPGVLACFYLAEPEGTACRAPTDPNGSGTLSGGTGEPQNGARVETVADRIL